MLTKAFVLLAALSCASAVVVKVDLHIGCAIPNLPFSASAKILEKDTIRVLDDVISDKFTFRNARSPQTLLMKSLDVDDGLFNNDLEPYLIITHNCRKNRKTSVNRLYLPDCPEIDNRKFCSYKVDVNLNKIVPATGKVFDVSKERRLTSEKE